jgi:hypothetical protein
METAGGQGRLETLCGMAMKGGGLQLARCNGGY